MGGRAASAEAQTTERVMPRGIEGPVGAPAPPAGSILPDLPISSARVARASANDARKAAAEVLESNSDEFRTALGESSRWAPRGASVLNPLYDDSGSRWDSEEGYDGSGGGDGIDDSMPVSGVIDGLGLGMHHVPYFLCAALAKMAEGVDLYTSLLVLRHIRCHMDLDLYEEAFLVSSSFFGSFLGAYVWGVLSDKYGRWIVGWVFPLLMGGGLVAASLTPYEPRAFGYTYIMTCRAVSGLGLGASPVFDGSLIEVMPTMWRGFAHLGAELHWVLIRLAVAGLGASYVQSNEAEAPWPGGWRFFLLLNAIPCLLVGLAGRWAQESPRFLVTAERANEAFELLAGWAKARHKQVPCTRIRREGLAQPMEQRGSVRRMFVQRRNTLMTANVWILTLFIWFAFVGITLLTTIFLTVEADKSSAVVDLGDNSTDVQLMRSDTLGSDPSTLEETFNDPDMFPGKNPQEEGPTRLLASTYFRSEGEVASSAGWLPLLPHQYQDLAPVPPSASMAHPRKGRVLLNEGSCDWNEPEKMFSILAFQAVSELPGVLFPALFIERIGRTKTLALSSALAVLTCLLVLSGPSRVASAALLFAGRFLCMSTIVVSRLYTLEAFPTSLRSTASASCFFLGQVSTLLTPLILVVGFEADPSLPMALISTACAMAFVSTLLLPLEPAGVALEDCAPERTFLHKTEIGGFLYSNTERGASAGSAAINEYSEMESADGSDDESEVGVGVIAHRHRDSIELL